MALSDINRATFYGLLNTNARKFGEQLKDASKFKGVDFFKTLPAVQVGRFLMNLNTFNNAQKAFNNTTTSRVLNVIEQLDTTPSVLIQSTSQTSIDPAKRARLETKARRYGLTYQLVYDWLQQNGFTGDDLDGDLGDKTYNAMLSSGFLRPKNSQSGYSRGTDPLLTEIVKPDYKNGQFVKGKGYYRSSDLKFYSGRNLNSDGTITFNNSGQTTVSHGVFKDSNAIYGYSFRGSDGSVTPLTMRRTQNGFTLGWADPQGKWISYMEGSQPYDLKQIKKKITQRKTLK